MKNMITFLKRIIKYGWQSFTRNPGIVLANVFILTLAIFLISSLVLFHRASEVLLNFLREKADVSVFFKENVSEDEILKVKEEILQNFDAEISFTSKEEALKEFKERHKENQILTEALKEIGENPFLASLSIKTKTQGTLEEIVGFLQKQKEELVEKIDYSQRKPLIERIFFSISNLNRLGIFLSIGLILIAVLVTFNTIRLAIINFGEEISIQRLVGASNWFIRGPFFVQGMIAGLFSGLISLFLIFLVCYFLSPKLQFFLEELNLFKIFSEKIMILILIHLLTGIFLGALSSVIAIRRYLKI